MKSERLFKIIGQIDESLIENAEKSTPSKKPAHFFRKVVVIAASLALVVGVSLFAVNNRLQQNGGIQNASIVSQQMANYNGTTAKSPSSQQLKSQYAALYGKINVKSNQNNSSAIQYSTGGVCVFGIDLSPLGISGSASSSGSTTIGNNLYVLVNGKDSAIHLAVVTVDKSVSQPYTIDSKSKLFAYVDLGAVIENLLGSPGQSGILSQASVGSICTINNDLLIEFSYNHSDVTKTQYLVYDVTDPSKPVLAGAFGQIGTAGTYTPISTDFSSGDSYSSGYNVEDDTVTLITHYVVQSPDQNNIYSYVPYSIYNGNNTLVSSDHIYAGAGQSNEYYVVTQWKISNTITQLGSYAFLGKTIINTYILGNEIIVPSVTQKSSVVDTTYGPWQAVPKDLQTAETGTKLREATSVDLTSYSTTLTLYSVQNGALTDTSSVTLSGSLIDGGGGIDLYNGNFRAILLIANDVGGSGGYENVNGVHVDSNDALNAAFEKEGFPIAKPQPDLSKYTGQKNALYIFNGKLLQIGTIPNITSLGIDKVSFDGDAATLTLYNGTITLNLSNPTEPKVK